MLSNDGINMNFKIRKFNKDDKSEVLIMMEEFYHSDAVSTNGSKDIYETDFENCINDLPFLDGYIFVSEDIVLGYAMIAKSFSTEFGKMCVWLEDLYLKKEYRGQNIIPQFLEYIKETNPNTLFKLEVEKDNSHAVYVYEKCGFSKLPYLEMMYIS